MSTSRPDIDATVWETLGAIHDPCSAAFGCPMSLVEMQLVKSVDFGGDRVTIGIQLTEPTCMYTFRISDAITSELRRRLGRNIEIDVHLVPPDSADVWTEERISAPARERLAAFRRQRARSRGATARPPRLPSEPATNT